MPGRCYGPFQVCSHNDVTDCAEAMVCTGGEM